MFGKNSSPKPSRIDSLIGPQTRIDGDVGFSGGLRIDGQIRGNIFAVDDDKATLTVGENGVIVGHIRVPNVLISGEVEGDVYSASHVQLSANARIHGNLYYHLLEMTRGSTVNGQLIHVPADEVHTLQVEHAVETLVEKLEHEPSKNS